MIATAQPGRVASQREVARRLDVSHTANEVLKAQEHRLRLDERKVKLVDKARALLLVHRLAKEERDAILAWPGRALAFALRHYPVVEPGRGMKLMMVRVKAPSTMISSPLM